MSLPFLRLAARYSDDTLSFDPLIIYLDAKATYGFDGQYDALKLFNTDKRIPNFYSFGSDSSRLSINAFPLTDTVSLTVRLGLKTERTAEIIFGIKNAGTDFNFSNISITDLATGNSQDLASGQEYKVEVPAGDYTSRFFLNLSLKSTDIPEIIPDDNWFKIYTSHGIIRTEINIPSLNNASLKIFDLMGDLLNVYKIYKPGYYEFNPNLKPGIYIVNFTSGTRRVAKKLYFQSQ